MNQVLGIIIARAGSKGLRDKCVRPVLGRPLIAYTFDHALAARRLTSIVLTTDSEPAKTFAREAGIAVIDRPAALAGDTATVDAAARHAVEAWEAQHGGPIEAAVLMYGNIPVRAPGVVDLAIEKLEATGASSVRSVALVSKQHPDWVHRLDGDRMIQFRRNSIYRRQDLAPLYYHDAAAVVVTREALFGALETPDDHQSFLGADRRAIVQKPEDAVDVDELIDLRLAEAVLTAQRQRDATGQAGAGLRIAARAVADGSPALVIAEIGVNHDGDVKRALQMIEQAADAGADAVKFQVFRAAELAQHSAPAARYQKAAGIDTSQQKMLEALQLDDDALSRLADHCRQVGVLFLATPFSPHDVERLESLSTPAFKIASPDLNNVPLIEHAVSTGKPLILSTGASLSAEIDEAIGRLHRLGSLPRTVLLHCVSAYPTPLPAANLGAIGVLKRRTGGLVGLSDHTVSLQTGGWAVAAGAVVLEKHVTYDRNATGPDHAMSLPPNEFAIYVQHVRDAEQALGRGELGMSPLEEDVRQVAGRSIVSRVDIPAGDALRADMLAVKRPAGGIAPRAWHCVLRQKAAVAIPADTQIQWDMLA